MLPALSPSPPCTFPSQPCPSCPSQQVQGRQEWLFLHFPPCCPFPEPAAQGSAGREQAGLCQSKQSTRRRRRRAAEAGAGKGQSPPADPAGSLLLPGRFLPLALQTLRVRSAAWQALDEQSPGVLSGTSGAEHPLCHPSGGFGERAELPGVREAKGERIPGWSSPASDLKPGLFLLPLCPLPGKAAGKYFPGNCFCSFLCVSSALDKPQPVPRLRLIPCTARDDS